MSAQRRPTIAIAGASGFIGRHLLAALAAQRRVIALSRRPSQARADEPDNVCWRSCDLFHLKQVEEGLKGAEIAVYLVHSMMPAARLTQGHFADLDLICADNFARAARKVGIRHIIYVGGLIPSNAHLSVHLRSRREVEVALADHGAQVTVLRAGLIFGRGGSSATMMVRLVRRLPVLLLPRWCQSHCQPVALDDLLMVLHHVIDDKKGTGEVLDVGGPDVLSYAQMLALCAQQLRVRRWQVPVPAFTPNLSLWWIAWVTSTPMELVRPLVTSLQHDMVVRPEHAAQRLFSGSFLPFAAALRHALGGTHERALRRYAPRRGAHAAPRSRGVVSVQRLPLPAGKDAAWVAEAYAAWLPKAFFWLRPLIRVVRETDASGMLKLNFVLRGVSWRLLQLDLAVARSDAQRQLFYISGGLLARPTEATLPGRLEFRVVLGQQVVLAAIHDFVPRLPWLLYKFTQALLHAQIMHGFARFLARPTPSFVAQRPH